MKYLWLLSAFISSVLALHAQNIVPNPSFLNYVTCPTNPGGISDNKCTSWDSPNLATPDYYHQCATTVSGLSVPTNGFGNQASPSGSYAGIVTYQKIQADFREYLTTDIPALLPGQKYWVTIYVSWADISTCASNGLSVFFYRQFHFYPTWVNIVCTPQINYSSYGVITDSVNWTKLTASFIADSAYTHMVIGNFNSDVNTDTLPAGPGTAFFDGAYYYVDSVAVEKELPTAVASPSNNFLSVRIFPIPVTEQIIFKVENSDTHPWQLYIFNSVGQQIHTGQYNQPVITLEQSDLNLPQGPYYYRVEYDNQRQTGKFSVQ